MLEIKHYTKSYAKGKNVVEDLSLKVEDKDIFAFVGHNGAGKTTTIKSVAGILEFDSGDILIDNVSIKDDPILCKSKIAYIPDNPDLYDHLKGIEYLNFIADVYNISLEERTKLIKNYSETFEISKNLGDLIASYSHGMKQKLAIISALIRKPRLLVLDEPFVGLDPKAAHSLKEIMKELCENNTSIFFSTHVLEVAEKLCNKIAIIKDGKLVITGDMKDVVKNKSLEDIFMELVEHE